MRRSRSIPATTVVFGSIATLATVATIAAIAWRMQRGIDWTDEAYYIAMPARFVMGDRPYVDELNIGENAGIFLWPFLKAWSAVAGWTGVFAFVRALYVVFFGFVGWSAYVLARTCRLAFAPSLLVGACCLCFIPYGLPGLSYNTIGTGLLAIGAFGTATALLRADDAKPFYRDRFFWSGVAFGCSTFAYPTFVLSAVGATAAVALLSTNRLRSTLLFCAGGVAVAVVLSPVFLRGGPAGLRAVLDYSFGGEPPSPLSFVDKVSGAWARFQTLNSDLWKGTALVGFAILAARRSPLAVGVLLPLLPLVLRPEGTAYPALAYFVRFGVYAPLFALALSNRKVAFTLIVAAWLPAVLSAVAVSVTSGNGPLGAGIGMYAGTIVSVLLFALWVEETSRGWTFEFLRPMTQLAPAAILFVMAHYVVGDYPNTVYRDGALAQLTEKISSGPYKGLYTTPHRKRWLAAVEADVHRYHAGKRVSFWFDFPAGYLFANQPPHIASVWNFPNMQRRTMMEANMLRDKLAPGEVIFRIGALNPTSLLDATVTARCKKVGSGEGYTVWVAD